LRQVLHFVSLAGRAGLDDEEEQFVDRDEIFPCRTHCASVSRRRLLSMACRTAWALPFLSFDAFAAKTSFDVRDFGAIGDGAAFDTAAIDRAIKAAADAGGGTVEIPAGRYLCFTLHLRSHVALRFAPGAVLIAATPDFTHGERQYDTPESQPEAIRGYQDYGHNHWHNSLIWGENLDNVALTGPGELWGRGLQKGDGAAEEKSGAGNKLIALKNCRNVLLRDLSLRDAGHFGVLASGIDSLSIENLRIDTRRDGIDIDACRDVHIRGCTVNAPWDDAIVLKASYSLGELRHTERVTISDCIVTGCYECGSVLDGSYRRFPEHVAEDAPSYVGRIKIGTETNGDVRNVVVTNCVLEGCHGLAVESEDGGHVEDISFSNVVMRDLVGPPIFVRLGGRLRGPAGTQVGAIRRVTFRDIDCAHAKGQVASIVTGIPQHPVEDLRIDGLRVNYTGGVSERKDEVPERVADYPDPEMFGNTPAQGVYVRHASRIELRDLRLRADAPDARPALWLEDVHDARIDDVVAQDAKTELVHAVVSSSVKIGTAAKD
jgi:polygalacturonase